MENFRERTGKAVSRLIPVGRIACGIRINQIGVRDGADSVLQTHAVRTLERKARNLALVGELRPKLLDEELGNFPFFVTDGVARPKIAGIQTHQRISGKFRRFEGASRLVETFGPDSFLPSLGRKNLDAEGFDVRENRNLREHPLPSGIGLCQIGPLIDHGLTRLRLAKILLEILFHGLKRRPGAPDPPIIPVTEKRVVGRAIFPPSDFLRLVRPEPSVHPVAQGFVVRLPGQPMPKFQQIAKPKDKGLQKAVFRRVDGEIVSDRLDVGLFRKLFPNGGAAAAGKRNEARRVELPRFPVRHFRVASPRLFVQISQQTAKRLPASVQNDGDAVLIGKRRLVLGDSREKIGEQFRQSTAAHRIVRDVRGKPIRLQENGSIRLVRRGPTVKILDQHQPSLLLSSSCR